MKLSSTVWEGDHEEEEVEVAISENAQIVLEVVAQHILPSTSHFINLYLINSTLQIRGLGGTHIRGN